MCCLRSFVFLVTFGLLCGSCAMLPGFGLLEDPAIYAFSVSDVANQVACELQEFMAEQIDAEKKKVAAHQETYKWVLDEGDVSVKLSLQTDSQGYVDFTGVNVAQLGLQSLASFIAVQSKVPILAAKLSAKRTRTVQVDFTVSPKPFATDKINKADPKSKTYNCDKFSLTNNPLTHLYLEDWLYDYFYKINDDYTNKPIPNQLKIQSVELSSQILLAVDISGGATPNLLGNGSTFVVPINGLSLDYNPDYSHKIDMTMNVCDDSATTVDGRFVKLPCFSSNNNTNLPILLLIRQCQIYGDLQPLLSGVKPPKDIPPPVPPRYGLPPAPSGYHLTCVKTGLYVAVKDVNTHQN